MWHQIGHVERLDTGEWRTRVQVPLESCWFSGHFPGDPVLPGIAQLGMVYEAVCQALGSRPGLAGFSRVKFKRIIRPLDCLNISVLPKGQPEEAYAFRILVGDDIACSGTMALETRNGAASQPRRPNP